MINLNILKEDLQQSFLELENYVKNLEDYIYEVPSLKVDVFNRHNIKKIEYNYNTHLKTRFTFLNDCINILHKSCLEIKSYNTNRIIIPTLLNLLKSLFISKEQKEYLLAFIKEGSHEIKKHIKYWKELKILTKEIEIKIDTINLLNCFIDEGNVIKLDNPASPLKDSHGLINRIFDEYSFWEEPFKDICRIGDHRYHLSKESLYCNESLDSDVEIWSELIKAVYAEEKCDPFLSLYFNIQTRIEESESKNSGFKKRKIS